MHLESKDHMEKHYEAELSNASDRTKREVDAITERLQMTHANELQKLKSSNDSLKADLDLVKLKETQLQEKVSFYSMKFNRFSRVVQTKLTFLFAHGTFKSPIELTSIMLISTGMVNLA